MSELNIPGFIAFLRGEVTIDGHWFGGDGPIRGGIRRNFWWREHLPKLSSHIERQDAEIAQLRADLSESRRLLDEARAQKPTAWLVWCQRRLPLATTTHDARMAEHYRSNGYSVSDLFSEAKPSAPVPAQPAALPLEVAADIRADDYVSPRLRAELGMPSHVAELATNIRRNLKHMAQTVNDRDTPHGGELLDYINHMDTIAQQIETDAGQPAAVPEAVAKDVSALDDAGQSNRKVAYAWFPLRLSRKRQLISDCGITLPQALTESDSQWAMRALLAMLERAECRAAILSAADTEVKNG